MMSMGSGDIISNSNKRTLNVNSSTGGELVATHDQMSDALHTLYFLEAQGVKNDKNMVLIRYAMRWQMVSFTIDTFKQEAGWRNRQTGALTSD